MRAIPALISILLVGPWPLSASADQCELIRREIADSRDILGYGMARDVKIRNEFTTGVDFQRAYILIIEDYNILYQVKRALERETYNIQLAASLKCNIGYSQKQARKEVATNKNLIAILRRQLGHVAQTKAKIEIGLAEGNTGKVTLHRR